MARSSTALHDERFRLDFRAGAGLNAQANQFLIGTGFAFRHFCSVVLLKLKIDRETDLPRCGKTRWGAKTRQRRYLRALEGIQRHDVRMVQEVEGLCNEIKASAFSIRNVFDDAKININNPWRRVFRFNPRGRDANG